MNGTESTPLAYVQDDRLCAGCGTSLLGRPIVREPRYGMMIARCGTCGRVEPIEAYPPLTRWTTRWAMLGTTVWLLFMIAFFLGGLGATCGMTIGISADALDPYQHHLRAGFEEWLRQRELGRWYETGNRERFPIFWAEQGERVRAEAGGVLSWTQRGELSALLVPAGLSFVLGGIWSVMLIHRRRGTVARWSAIAMAIPAAIYITAWIITASMEIRSDEHALFVDRVFGFVAGAGAVNIGLYFLGVTTGRSIARGLVRALLPPRRRGALGVMWRADGLEPPVTERIR